MFYSFDDIESLISKIIATHKKNRNMTCVNT